MSNYLKRLSAIGKCGRDGQCFDGAAWRHQDQECHLHFAERGRTATIDADTGLGKHDRIELRCRRLRPKGSAGRHRWSSTNGGGRTGTHWLAAVGLPLFLLASGLPLSAAAANCTANTNDGQPYYVATLDGLDVPEFDPGTIPIGGTIYSVTGRTVFVNAREPGSPITSCDPGHPPSLAQAGIGVPSNHIYPTSIPNIGVRIRSQGAYWPFIDYTSSNSEVYWSISYEIQMELIKTGPITAAGVLQGAFGRYLDKNTDETLVEFRFARTVPVRPQVPSCNVATPDIPVSMGTVSPDSFSGPNSVSSPAQLFEIRLSCSGGQIGTATNAHITLTDQSHPANRTTTLSLSPTSTAEGYGIQILRGDTVLSYGPDSAAVGNPNQWKAGTIAQGVSTFIIPLSARYIQTTTSTEPGSADAVATFTMSYQ